MLKSITLSGIHNIPAVTSKTYEFKDVNYIHGLNGSGKSTILQAIQLAILGYIPNTSKNISSIFKHANGSTMRIKLTFDDDSYIERVFKLKGRSIESNVSTDIENLDEYLAELVGDLELPIFNFNELINMTANKLKDWFIHFLPSTSDNIDWKQELTQSLGNMNLIDPNLLNSVLDEIIIESKNHPNTLELIQTLNATWKKEQTYLKSELKRAEDTIQSLIYHDDDNLAGSEEYLLSKINEYKEKIAQLTRDKETVIEGTKVIAANDAVYEKLNNIDTSAYDVEDLKNQLSILSTRLHEKQELIPPIEVKIQELSTEYQTNANLIESKNNVIHGNGICPYSNTTCDSILDIIKQYEMEVLDIGKRQLDLEQMISTEKSHKTVLNAEIATVMEEFQQIHNRISYAEALEASKKHLEDLIVPAPDLSKFQNLDYYKIEIEKLNSNISKIEANMKYNKLITELTANKYKLENTLEAYKCWIKLTDPNGLQTKIMDSPFNNFAIDMDEYLMKMFSSSDIHCRFNLEQKANSFSFGIERNNIYIPYDLLSSGEKAIYTLAMMLTIIHKSNAKLKLLIADDMLDHLDDERADQVFGALENITDTQVIIAGIKKSAYADSYTIYVR